MAVIKNKDGSVTIGEVVEEKAIPVEEVPTDFMPAPIETETTETVEGKPKNKGGRPRKN